MSSKKYAKQLLFPVFGIIAMLFLFITIMGCNKEFEMVDTLEVGNLNPVVRASGGTVSLDITSNASWKVGEINADWLHIENTTGTGDGQLNLACDENDAVESRAIEFFIVTTKDGKYHKVTLTQLATDPFLELEQHELEVGSRPRSHEIKLNTNIPAAAIRAEIIYEQEEETDWVIGINVETEALKFQTALNTLEEERKATIILSYEDATGEDTEVWDKITITQMASGNDGPAEDMSFSYVKGLPIGIIDENISVTGNIVSTGVSDNFRKNTYIIQDENGMALAFESVNNLSLDKYDKIQLLLDGAQIETFEDGGTPYKVIKGISTANILSRSADAGFSPPIIHISELTDNNLLSLVTLEDVEFAIPYGGYTNFHEPQTTVPPDMTHYPNPIRDIQGDHLYLITNYEVAYRRNSVPKGSGKITGLIVKIANSAYGDLGTYSIRHLEESDIAINPNKANGFSETLVEWENAWTTGDFTNGTANLPPSVGPAGATLGKNGSPGFWFSGAPENGVNLIAKYRGDNPGSSTAVNSGCYNVNSWDQPGYWIMGNVSTLGITTSLSLHIEVGSLRRAPRDFVVEYALSDDNWQYVASYSLTQRFGSGVGVVAGFKMLTFKLPNELLNQPSIKIRLRYVGNNISVDNNTVTSTSTSQLVHFSIKYNK